jgi:transformation/transcription domain-associated protein
MPVIVNTLALKTEHTARNKPGLVDFVAAQVKVTFRLLPFFSFRFCFKQLTPLPFFKTLSFLAYLLRGFAEHLRPYQADIPKYVIQLLHSCPSESAAIRKVHHTHTYTHTHMHAPPFIT